MKPLLYLVLVIIAVVQYIAIYLPGVTPLYDPFTLLVGNLNMLAIILAFQVTTKYHNLFNKLFN